MPGMHTLFRAAGKLRWPWLVYTLPPVVMWAKAFPYFGALIVLGHSMLVLLFGVLCDMEAMRARREIRLAVLGPRTRLAPVTLWPMAGFLVLAVIAVIVLTAISFAVCGLASLQAAALMFAGLVGVLLSGTIARRIGPTSSPGTWRRRMSEVIAPALTLFVPMLALRTIAQGNQVFAMSAPASGDQPQTLPELIDPRTISATLLWSVVMGVFMLVCQIRDEADDRSGLLPTKPPRPASADWRTTAHVLGVPVASVVAILWAGLATVLACMGTAHHHWGWITSAAIALGAMVGAWCGGAGRIGRAALTLTIAAAVAGVAMVGGR